MQGNRGTSLAWLGHPGTVLALMVLLVNDHYLKAAHPGWWTGKLSDAAGLVLAPALLATVVALVAPRCRPRWVALGATVTVGVGFATIKTFGYAAAAASTAWSVFTPSVVRADRTDLLALPFLLVAWRVFRHAAARPAPSGRLWRAARVGVLLPAALFGVAATSAVQITQAVAVHSAAGEIYLGVSGNSGVPHTWAASRDGGRTWSPSSGPGAVPEPRGAVCSAANAQLCYRVVPAALAVQASTDGGVIWTDSWRVTEEQRAALNRHYDDDLDPERHLVSRAVAVHDLPSGGHVVVVANGRDGFAIRDVGGRWTRIGYPSALGPYAAAPPDLAEVTGEHRAEDALFAVALSIFLAGLVLTLGGLRANARAGGSPHLAWTVVPQALIGPPLLLVAGLARAAPGSLLDVFPLLAPFMIGLVALVGAGLALSMAWSRTAEPGRWLGRTALALVLTVAADTLLVAIWLATGAESTVVIVLGAAVVWAAGSAATWVAARSARPRASEPDPPFPPAPVAAQLR